MGKWISMVLPFVQMVLAICLMARWWAKEVYLLTLFVCMVFLAAQLLTLRRGMEISCGCFGVSASFQVGWQTVLISSATCVAALMGLSCLALRARNRADELPGAQAPVKVISA